MFSLIHTHIYTYIYMHAYMHTYDMNMKVRLSGRMMEIVEREQKESGIEWGRKHGKNRGVHSWKCLCETHRYLQGIWGNKTDHKCNCSNFKAMLGIILQNII